MKILVIHGPNLDRLGKRETNVYGTETLETINKGIASRAAALSLIAEAVQMNHEGEIVEAIGKAEEHGYNGIIINPAAYTHTSIAILDAIRGTTLPVIEVHLSNIAAREEYRRRSVTAEATVGQITGFGAESYLLALEAMKSQVEKRKDRKR